MTSQRYQVVEGSQTSHCCFVATVVDTAKIGPRVVDFEEVCECFEVEAAHRICKALNAQENPA
jgi:hypothetical protein